MLHWWWSTKYIKWMKIRVYIFLSTLVFNYKFTHDGRVHMHLISNVAQNYKHKRN